jgi:hypothetical protein
VSDAVYFIRIEQPSSGAARLILVSDAEGRQGVQRCSAPRVPVDSALAFTLLGAEAGAADQGDEADRAKWS